MAVETLARHNGCPDVFPVGSVSPPVLDGSRILTAEAFAADAVKRQRDAVSAIAEQTPAANANGEGVAPPTLAVVVTRKSDDSISYLIQALTHGRAIGLIPQVYASAGVRTDPRLTAVLERLKLDTLAVFQQVPGLDEAELNIGVAMYQELALQHLGIHPDPAAGPEYTRLRDRATMLTAKIEWWRTRSDKTASDVAGLVAQLHNVHSSMQAEVADLRKRTAMARLAKDTATADLLEQIGRDSQTDKTLVLLPSEERAGEPLVRAAVARRQDVDGVRPQAPGEAPLHHPITPLGMVKLAAHFIGQEGFGARGVLDIPPEQIVVAGGGPLVGQPLMALLQEMGVDTTRVHYLETREQVEAWRDTPRHMRPPASLIFGCARAGNYIDARTIRPGEHGTVIIDAGNVTTIDPQTGQTVIQSNVDPRTLDPSHAVYATPRLRGTGMATVVELFDRTIAAGSLRILGHDITRPVRAEPADNPAAVPPHVRESAWIPPTLRRLAAIGSAALRAIRSAVRPALL